MKLQQDYLEEAASVKRTAREASWLMWIQQCVAPALQNVVTWFKAGQKVHYDIVLHGFKKGIAQIIIELIIIPFQGRQANHYEECGF